MLKSTLLFALLLGYCAIVMAQQNTLTIKVVVPSHTADGDSVIVIGNQAVWGNWLYPKSKALQKMDAYTWQAQYTFPTQSNLEFKITRGSFFKEALYNHTGHPPAATKLTLTRDTTITLSPTAWNDAYQRSIVGQVRYHHNVSSPLLKNTRHVMVWLPPSYFKNPAKTYPVLYAQDGQNIFDHTNLSGHEWQMDEIADSLMQKGEIEEFIIVGIFNSKDRMIEYSGTPEGYHYLSFIAHELKPFVDKEYRTKKDRDNTAIIGSSMGGLISLYMLWEHGDIFSKAACFSSGFYLDDGSLFTDLRRSTAKLNHTKIYLDCGGVDLDKDFLPQNEEVHQLLAQNKKITMEYKYFPKDPHNELAWRKRLPNTFKFLFGKK